MCCKGCKGITLLKGNGIVSTVDNNDGTFTITYDNGDTFTTSDFTGPSSGFVDYWTYNSTTTPSGASQIRFDSTNTTSITKIYISNDNFNSVDVTQFLESFKNESPNPSGIGVYNRYGEIKVSSLDQNDWITFKIISISFPGTYTEFEVFPINYSNVITVPFTNNSKTRISFVPNLNAIDELIVPIGGNWNMDTTNVYNITIASLAPYITNHEKIVDVQAMIGTNTGSSLKPLNVVVGSDPQGTVDNIDVTNIALARTTAGLFDDPVYNAATGYVTIKYLK